MKSEWTETCGGRIHSLTFSQDHGSLPVVVLVHGLVISSQYMIPTAQQLTHDYHVEAPDLPGYGKSYKPTKILNLYGLAGALAEWMTARGIKKAHFVGNSFGCQILAEFALQHSEKINRLVLQGPTVDPAARSLGRQMLRLVINSRREHPGLGRITRADYRAAGVRRAWSTIQMALKDRIEDKLPYVYAPTLVVRGDKDPLVPQQWAERAATLMPRGALCIIPGAAHTLNYSAPEQFAAAIRPFLRSGEP
jgi:2-hydroxy-6-oxonona-2,4-dienedioate hydrolase